MSSTVQEFKEYSIFYFLEGINCKVQMTINLIWSHLSHPHSDLGLLPLVLGLLYESSVGYHNLVNKSIEESN